MNFIKVLVEIYLIFMKIGEIDTLNEKFQAEAIIETCWESPAFNKEV